MDQALPAKIMVIGNDSHFCFLMRRYVRESSFSLVFAYPNENILEMAQQANPAAIILEVNPPGAMSWLALRALKSDSKASHIPVILCSWQDDESRGINEGADVCLRLPILYSDSGGFGSLIAGLGILTSNWCSPVVFFLFHLSHLVK
jgi:DNA-binding response OmpR family regulator